MNEKLEDEDISFADVWYMDDGQLICRPEDVDKILRTFDIEAARVGAKRGIGERAKTVCRLIGPAEAKNAISPDWVTDYVASSVKQSADNDLEGHVLGIDFDDAQAASKQFVQASEVAAKARAKLSEMNDVPCEMVTLQ